MYLSKDIFQFKYNNRNIKLISVRHNVRNIDIDLLKSLLDESNKSKVCYLLETDYRKNKMEIRKNFGDHTTEQFMRLLLNEEKKTKIKKCIKGWDVRQSILTQNNQDHLYSNFYNLPFNSIHNFYFQKLEERVTQNNDLDKNIKIFIDHNYKQAINHFKKSINNELYHIHKIIKNEKNFMMLPIKTLIQKYNNTKDMFKKLSKLLFHSFAVISDLFLLENILSKSIKSDYIIIMGEFHFNDTINFVNLMKKDNLF